MSYKNISFYKAHRSKLLGLLYPEEWSNIGKVVFKQPPYEGITARLWHDEIEIIFDANFLSQNKELFFFLTREMTSLRSYCSYTLAGNMLKVFPVGKNNFSDTELGMQQRAAYYVLILELCLKLIQKHFKSQ